MGRLSEFPHCEGRPPYLPVADDAARARQRRRQHDLSACIRRQKHIAVSKPAEVEPLPLKTLDLGEKYDPIMPITMEWTDMRLLSVYKQQETLNLSEIDLGSSTPELEQIKLSAGSGSEASDVVLHKSWAHRPTLILEIGALEAEKKTQLVLSRSKVTTPDRNKQPTNGLVDSVQLEVCDSGTACGCRGRKDVQACPGVRL